MADSDAVANRARVSMAIHADVWRLGFVSMLTDLSSEMIFAVFALYFIGLPGATPALLGMVEGLADFSAAALTLFAGRCSDRSGQRKCFALMGYGFSTLAKSALLFGNSLLLVGGFRVVERLGKSFRGPPRDAWLAAVAGDKRRGFAFGVHKALDKTGAVIGPLLAYALLTWQGDKPRSYQLLFWGAILPALLAVLLLARVRDRPAPPLMHESLLQTWRQLGQPYRYYLRASAIFSLGYFSVGFSLLRAHELGFSLPQTILLYTLFNAVFVVAAPFAGQLADRLGRRQVIALGYLLYCLLCAGFALANTAWHVLALFVMFGLFYAIDEAQGKAWISELEPQRRATALGLYGAVCGVLYLPASLMAGLWWQWHPAAAFVFSSLLALIALVQLVRMPAEDRDLPASL